VAFPDDSLAQGEEVKLHLHPHWIVMTAPGFWTVVDIGGVIAGVTFLPSSTAGNVALVAIGVLALALFIWRSFAPFVVWRSTHFVFTTKQVMFRHGVFTREQRSIPLEKVNDVKATQNALGAGSRLWHAHGGVRGRSRPGRAGGYPARDHSDERAQGARRARQRPHHHRRRRPPYCSTRESGSGRPRLSGHRTWSSSLSLGNRPTRT
jgi:membrane protein YdbS with pleckstrin-like domain